MAGFVGGEIIALPAKIRRWPIQLYLAYTSDNKLVIYRFDFGEFNWSEKCTITITSHSSDILEYDTFAV